jgi:hypothetical protein
MSLLGVKAMPESGGSARGGASSVPGTFCSGPNTPSKMKKNAVIQRLTMVAAPGVEPGTRGLRASRSYHRAIVPLVQRFTSRSAALGLRSARRTMLDG